MSVTVRILGGARAEMQDAADWYEAGRAGGAARFLAAVEHALAQIAEHPERYPAWQGSSGFRRVLVNRYPYLVFYRLKGEIAVVHAVAHTSRRPGYWLKREG